LTNNVPLPKYDNGYALLFWDDAMMFEELLVGVKGG
jgi:hypothetical protein